MSRLVLGAGINCSFPRVCFLSLFLPINLVHVSIDLTLVYISLDWWSLHWMSHSVAKVNRWIPKLLRLFFDYTNINHLVTLRRPSKLFLVHLSHLSDALMELCSGIRATTVVSSECFINFLHGSSWLILSEGDDGRVDLLWLLLNITVTWFINNHFLLIWWYELDGLRLVLLHTSLVIRDHGLNIVVLHGYLVWAKISIIFRLLPV